MATTNVRVNLPAIQSMFQSYGEIGRFGQRTSQRSVAFAQARVGRRTGRLAASIRSVPAAGLLHYTISIRSPLKYAAWVNAGTTTPITPKTGIWLAVGKREGKKPIYRQYVLGQRAQRYLEGGVEDALALEGIGIHLISF